MISYSIDLIRRTEILAFALNGCQYSKEDYAQKYKVQSITIDRDLRFLRDKQIPIHSRKNIIGVFGELTSEKLKELLSEYVPLKLYSNDFSNQIKSISKIYKEHFFGRLVLLSIAVQNHNYIKIKYRRRDINQELDYILKPVRLLNTDKNWIIHAIKENHEFLQTFYLSRITHIDILNKKFKNIPFSRENNTIYKMVFQFKPEVSRDINEKIFFDEFELEELKDGSIRIVTNLPISNKLASWCISWWSEIEVIEPPKLKHYIAEMIQSFQSNNKLV